MSISLVNDPSLLYRLSVIKAILIKVNIDSTKLFGMEEEKLV